MSQTALPTLEISPKEIEFKAPFLSKKTVEMTFYNPTAYPIAFRGHFVASSFPQLGVLHLSMSPSNGVVPPKKHGPVSISFDPRSSQALLQPGQFEHLSLETIFAPQWKNATDGEVDEIWKSYDMVRSSMSGGMPIPNNYYPHPQGQARPAMHPPMQPGMGPRGVPGMGSENMVSGSVNSIDVINRPPKTFPISYIYPIDSEKDGNDSNGEKRARVTSPEMEEMGEFL